MIVHSSFFPVRSLAFVAFGALLAVAEASAGCKRLEGSAEGASFTADSASVTLSADAPRPVGFGTATAELGAPLEPSAITGRITTVERLTAPSYAPLAGRVAEVRARLGDHVKEGDKLVAVKAADLSTLQHDLAAANLSIKTKEAVVERTRQLVEARAGSQNDLALAESELAEAKLASQNASARIQSLSVKDATDTTYWVVAERSGTVVELNAAPGQIVGPDKDKPIATVADLDELLVVADLRQREASGVAKGQVARISTPGTKEEHHGTIDTLSDVVDPERQTIPVRILIDNQDHALRPNTFVNVVFESPSDRGQIVEVPAQSVVSDGADSVVFIETAPGVYKRRKVEVGRQTKEKAEITSGLAAGDHVVSQGALLLLNALDVED